MPSEESPRKRAANMEKCHGRRYSASSTRDTSARETSGAQPIGTFKRYHWYRNDAGNRPPPHPPSDRGPGPYQWRNGGVVPRQEHQAESCAEQRRAHSRQRSVGPRHGRKTDGSIEPVRENQAESGMGPRGGTGRPPGSAPWPENIPNGRHRVWAVPGKDWLILLPSTVEPMELNPREDVEEEMEVDPPAPEQTWDSRGMSLLSAIREHRERRRSARPAPYLLSLRLHAKH